MRDNKDPESAIVELQRQIAKLIQEKDEIDGLNHILAHRIADLQLVLSVIPAGIVLCEDPEGKSIYINPYAARLFCVSERTSRDALKHGFTKFYHDGAELSVDELPFQIVMTNGEPIDHQEIRIVHEEGNEIRTLASASPLFDNNGQVRGAVGVFVDITQLINNRQTAEAQTQQRLTLTRQAERLSALGALAAGIAHEINNPLNAILMNAELALMSLNGQVDPERLTETLGRIIEDARRGGKITRNMLQFSNADNYAPQGLADLNQVITNARPLMVFLLRKKGATLEYQLEQNLPELALNPTAMEQALVSLVHNAAESGASRVSVDTASNGNYVTLIVRDNGPGIAPQDLKYIFDPFFITSRNKNLSGLSLSLVHRIISDHNGTVNVKNLPQGGIQFKVRLPLPTSETRPDG